jgi:hypothetical protein
MAAIDWKGMPHSMLVDELARGLEEKDTRIKALEQLTAPRAGRPKARNGFDAPKGDLDDATAGEA